ncbi:hypothetical protein BpHYR1_015357 [Brachionus plicatilis]|uniref:Uncharacterized protein n=1 Tax=Brachionus plicatilis TaxID=10195 RepID=A0A3M7T508_BRAPC|nr:hypothetical protein BpHYR1_015357 [Brachionus plicatilis]
MLGYKCLSISFFLTRAKCGITRPSLLAHSNQELDFSKSSRENIREVLFSKNILVFCGEKTCNNGTQIGKFCLTPESSINFVGPNDSHLAL